MGSQPGRTVPTYTPPWAGSLMLSPHGCVSGHPSSKGTWLEPVSFSHTWPFASMSNLGERWRHREGPAPGLELGARLDAAFPSHPIDHGAPLLSLR